MPRGRRTGRRRGGRGARPRSRRALSGGSRGSGRGRPGRRTGRRTRRRLTGRRAATRLARRGRRTGRAWLRGAVRSARPAHRSVELTPGRLIDQHDLSDRRGRRFHRHHTVRLEGGPPRAGISATRTVRRQQRVATRTTNPRHTLVVDQDSRAGLQNGLVGGRLAVVVAVVGHARVLPQHHRGEAVQVAVDLRVVDAFDSGPGPALVGVLGQVAGELRDVTAGDLPRTAVQARCATVHGPTGRGRTGCARCGPVPSARRPARPARPALTRPRGVGDGSRERILAGGGDGLESHVLS
ncbi:hypothetical protein KCH_03350 [Kitasatospora cheerisanensis KCTC 2395]|uniref:Uncharacterized protein n=1 Tax=Kitasatospora cheerisanensis KCTC 2395 TaxID=1348663 RepID=A0A066Z329_9ACTN|nr:hypothetical protein KCH_03350 [Kitasatospora cheerisanensis KCTC 2395]